MYIIHGLMDSFFSISVVVGSNPGTYKIIENGFAHYLQLMDDHLKAGYRFCLGSRPCAADFAMFGQLHPMIGLE